MKMLIKNKKMIIFLLSLKEETNMIFIYNLFFSYDNRLFRLTPLTLEKKPFQPFNLLSRSTKQS